MTPKELLAQPAWRRAAARAVLILGAALIGGLVARSAPREQVLVFRFQGSPASKELAATWTPVGDQEPAGGVTVQLSSPTPREVRHKVSLPNGEYVVDLEFHGAGDPSPDLGAETRTERRVTLEGGETVIYLGRPGL
jgi:hypothetical protein